MLFTEYQRHHLVNMLLVIVINLLCIFVFQIFLFCIFVFQIFEWWYFKKYGTSFIEQVSLNHISPLLGGGEGTNNNENGNNNGTNGNGGAVANGNNNSTSNSNNSGQGQQSMPGRLYGIGLLITETA